ncbi:MAG: molybdopterin converting factor subunit 1 [Chloroflexota bacterium]|jgi:molybdopterin converting factor subunit 1
MVITVRFFATLRDRAGDDAVDLVLPGEASVGQLLSRLAENYPALDPALASALVAVNHEYAFQEDLLTDGDEVALFPPVSGG